jgi:CheY-like chemotaxis protein
LKNQGFLEKPPPNFGLDGPGALQALRGIDPRVACVFITGHPGDYDAAALAAMGAVAVLRKPFLPGDLDAALRRLPRFAGPPAAG